MDIFIRRPYIALVISLLILILGLISLTQLNVREFPELKIATITIKTLYAGAAAQKIQSFITVPLQEAIASAEGIDYITGSSTQGSSVINVYVKLNQDPNSVLTQIVSKINAVKYLLPTGAQDPSILLQSGISFPALIVNYRSTDMTVSQISAYLSKVIRPTLQDIPGLSFINVYGNQPFALRIWLNPLKMLAYNLSVEDVTTALANNNVLTPAGKLNSGLNQFTVNVNTDLHTAQDFAHITLRNHNNALVKLSDVSRIEIGAQSYNSSLIFNGQKGVNLAFILQPGANPMTVIKTVLQRLPSVATAFPPGLTQQIVYDSTQYIEQSLNEVLNSLGAAILIVTLIVFIFLGSVRLAIIPVLAIPLSLIGACIFLKLLGFSINTLVLLAMVLAIGLVVDDAIVVLENIHRLGHKITDKFQAASIGIKEVFVPIITMSLTLSVVFIPIGLVGGLTGSLFKEFAVTLAATVLVSGVVAVILTPMLCANFLSTVQKPFVFTNLITDFIEKLENYYSKILANGFKNQYLLLLLAVITLWLCAILFCNTPRALAPQEDQSYLGVSAFAPADASLRYLEYNAQYLEKIYQTFPGLDKFFIINGTPQANNIFSGVILQPLEKRNLSQMALARLLQAKLTSVPGLNAFVFQLPTVPTAGDGPPIQFVIRSTLSHEKIHEIASGIASQANRSGLFAYIDEDTHFDSTQLDFSIDHNKAADLGVSMEQINQALTTLWGEKYINYFSYYGNSYQVIPQADQDFRFEETALQSIYLRSKDQNLFPLSNILTMHRKAGAAVLEQFQQMNAITLQGIPAKNVSLGEALQYLQNLADQKLPPQMNYSYSGESRALIQESNKLISLLIFAVILIYLLLVLQFESFMIPVVILVSVPLSLFGALLAMYCGLATINIYTEIGLVTLIGLISKHGILLVDLALKKLKQNLPLHESITQAATQRLRPILMTTAAMVLGVVPLMQSTGAGSHSRYDLGIVIFSGMLIGTVFTLFIVPVLLGLMLELLIIFKDKTYLKSFAIND